MSSHGRVWNEAIFINWAEFLRKVHLILPRKLVGSRYRYNYFNYDRYLFFDMTQTVGRNIPCYKNVYRYTGTVKETITSMIYTHSLFRIRSQVLNGKTATRLTTSLITHIFKTNSLKWSHLSNLICIFKVLEVSVGRL